MIQFLDNFIEDNCDKISFVLNNIQIIDALESYSEIDLKIQIISLLQNIKESDLVVIPKIYTT